MIERAIFRLYNDAKIMSERNKYLEIDALIIFTNSRKSAIGFTPGVFQGVYFEVFISFVHSLGIIVKEKCSPFNQGIIQQPIMSINKVITPMTELSDPPSMIMFQIKVHVSKSKAIDKF